MTPKGGRPVRDQGGIKAGLRRDYILFHLILTDYQLLLFSCMFSSYRHLHYISHPRYSASDWGRSIMLAAHLSHARPPTQGSSLPARASARASASASARGVRALLFCILGIILIETLPVAYSSISNDYLQPYGDCKWLFFSTVAGVSEDSSMHILHFPAPCNRIAGCLPLKGLISQLLGECWRAIGIVSRLRSLTFHRDI